MRYREASLVESACSFAIYIVWTDSKAGCRAAALLAMTGLEDAWKGGSWFLTLNIRALTDKKYAVSMPQRAVQGS